MTTLTQSKVPLQFLLSEGNGQISRGNITVLSGEGKLEAGRVLGRTLVAATAAASAKAGNTGGSGTITMDVTTPVLPTAKLGRYSILCIEPATNAGVFEVVDPTGVVIGTVNAAGSAFATQIKFTISDATDFVSGDGFFVDVSGVSYKYRSANVGNTDGSAVAVAVLGYPVDATSADQSAMGLVRGPTEVKGPDLVYDSSVSSAALIAQKVAELAAVGIIVR